MYNSERLVAPRAFLIVDCLLVVFALVAAFCLADQVKLSTNLGAILAMRLTLKNLLRAAEVFLFWAVLMRCLRVYTEAAHGPFSETLRVAVAVTGTALLLENSFDLHHKGASAPQIAIYFAVFCFVALSAVRAFVFFLSHHSRSGLLGRRSVLIIGTGPRAVRAFRHVRTQLHRSHSLLGFVDSRMQSLSAGEVESLYLGSLANLECILLNQVVDEVIIALPARSCYAEIEQAVEICSRVGVEILYPDDLFTFAPSMAGNNTSNHNPGMVVLRPAAYDARLVVKRLADIVLSALAIVVLSPLMLLIAALVKLTSPGPVFFLQERYGLGRRRFRILKFRTMVVDAEAKLKDLESLNEAHGPIFKIKNDPRLTKAGGFLRRTSLDELPQLFNVFLGHMSLVGPRPMSVRDVSLFTQASLMRRFSVKPGITCLWQVNGRSNTSFNRWIELDLHYIDNWSLGLDAKILALTIPAVVKGSGAM
jgi:exopolysaccharide biosynthesis polyprenyl glycosylphosphotransferase